MCKSEIFILKAGNVPMEILARGHEAMEAFNDALAEGEAEVNQGRTVFMGLERVGKTSTIKSFLRNTFDPNEGITDAIANTTVCTHELHDELNWKETSPDHSGTNSMYEEKMVDSIAKKLFEKSNKENVEVTEQGLLSPANAETKYNRGQSSLNTDARTPKIEPNIKERTETKSMEEVPENIASKVQNVLKFTRDAASDWKKSGNDFIMNIWDFGGQSIYHVIQRIFMVSFAVVCVVFNLEDDLDAPAKVRDPTTGEMYQHRMTYLQFILYWIRSVYTNSRDSKLDDGQLSPCGGERIFYVLSRLKPKRIHATQTKDYGICAVSIFHDFGNYLPDDVFQRGVTKFIERFQVKDVEPTLSNEHVEVDIDEFHLVVLSVASIKHRRMFKTTIIRRNIFNAAQLTQEDEPSPIVCKKVLTFLERGLKICQSGARGVELTRYIACDCRDAHMHIVRQFDMDVLPCGSNGMEVTRYRRLFEDDVQQQELTGMGRRAPWLPRWIRPCAKGVQPSRRVTRARKGQRTDKDNMLKQDFVDDAVIATVSEEMNYSWKGFGVRLGVSWARVNRFCAEERRDSQKAIANMMKYWRNNVKNETHQLKVLCIALRQHKYKRLAGELFSGDLGDEILTLAKHEGYLADVDLLFVAERLGVDWRAFGIDIGLKDHEMQQIEMSFPPPPIVDAILEMLVEWREKQEPQENYLAKMSNELEAFGKRDISEELNNYYQEKYQ
ncbi:uncharacterized protein LOC117111803 [Anneissia japonica]|uniref:uncharacterized protein LOC117111803 n=1 Tax=Anneissia japonica TaxID=1529436 RepID=UPI001425A3FC|nr:uncharacterized protein LOC117111803 [Anneissia japonica]